MWHAPTIVVVIAILDFNAWKTLGTNIIFYTHNSSNLLSWQFGTSGKHTSYVYYVKEISPKIWAISRIHVLKFIGKILLLHFCQSRGVIVGQWTYTCDRCSFRLVDTAHVVVGMQIVWIGAVCVAKGLTQSLFWDGRWTWPDQSYWEALY